MGEQQRLEDEEVDITLRRAWERALRSLATRLSEPTFKTHIRTLRPLSLVEEAPEEGAPGTVWTANLGVPSAFTREWVEKRHGVLIRELLEEILDRDIRLRFTILPRPAAPGDAVARTLSLFGEEETDALFTPAAAAGAEPVAADGSGDPAAAEAASAVDPRQPSPSATEAAAADPTAALNPKTAPGGPAGRPRGAAAAPSETAAAAAKPVRRDAGYSADAPPLNGRYTFENFVTGPSNRLAHAGAKAVAQSPGQVYNPLFLYGPSGLGKTHLMHAIGNEILASRGIDPSRVAYVSGEMFTSNFITSLREQRTEEFRRKWRNVDLWLVDDVQFIAGKETTKEEFFHTFNALYQTGKQIVLSSDRSPRELRMMDERLRSRFEAGLIADIAPPDLETRLAILHMKADHEGMRIPDEVLLYLARLVQNNIRTLEGALVKLIAYASVVNTPVTTELASSVLERYYVAAGVGAAAEDSEGGRPAASRPGGAAAGNGRGGAPLALSPEVVQRVVARRFGLSPDLLTGKKRDREIVTARQVAMHLLRELTEMSLPGIGRVFSRDHTTVLHACDRVRSQLAMDDDLRSLVEDLAIQLRAQAAG